MAVQLVEIYQDKVAPFQKIATKQSTAYSLREIYVNPEYVVMLRPSVRMNNEVKNYIAYYASGFHMTKHAKNHIAGCFSESVIV